MLDAGFESRRVIVDAQKQRPHGIERGLPILTGELDRETGDATREIGTRQRAALADLPQKILHRKQVQLRLPCRAFDDHRHQRFLRQRLAPRVPERLPVGRSRIQRGAGHITWLGEVRCREAQQGAARHQKCDRLDNRAASHQAVLSRA